MSVEALSERGKPICVWPGLKVGVRGRSDYPYEFSGQFPPTSLAAPHAVTPRRQSGRSDRELQRKWPRICGVFGHEADLEAFQMNFNGCHSLDQLLASMTLFMQEVKPLVER